MADPSLAARLFSDFVPRTVSVPAEAAGLDLRTPVRPGPVGPPGTTYYEMFGPDPKMLAERKRLFANAKADVPVVQSGKASTYTPSGRGAVAQRIRDVARLASSGQPTASLAERATRPVRSARGAPLRGAAAAASRRAANNAAMALVGGRLVPLAGAAQAGWEAGSALYDLFAPEIQDALQAAFPAKPASGSPPRQR